MEPPHTDADLFGKGDATQPLPARPDIGEREGEGV